jgi:hypothetical protein
MKNALSRMSAEELSLVLCISEETVKTLAKTKQIPFVRQKNRLYFDFTKVLDHFRKMEGGTA